MARNSEKAQSMLYRFRAQQAREMGMISASDPRPRDIQSVTDIQTCERWRSQVVKDISRKVNRVHDRARVINKSKFADG
ncbi:Pre-mRNA-splicing factor isy1 [Neolecta irregularis DAH-3]|uniref:Pre-mRNA-splicing factor isy1 n=1 Tax=Neolecta irregularis (strain DAH-3) TaxID=1198029 RepID=A0A1U7LK09_NEOID|nr:Pre-mRNA-splicing factor isy1 [Neolecta irregularis DAH-3]|eukprot:OLL22995.1 Pre-mRNA-splicing factor isy1 [Neolecta irregularis DAH-3]